MKKTTCFVCKNDFYGRNNQIFCSIECKNKHNNTKTRMIYGVGKYGNDKIANIQDQIYSNNERFKKAYALLEADAQINKAERAALRKDYEDLLNNCNDLKADLEKVKGKYTESRNSLKKSEEQLKIIAGLGELLRPIISKVFDNLGETEDKKNDIKNS